MNIGSFVAISFLALAGAMAAATLPRLIHAALAFAITFVGVAAFYFLLGAEFVGLVQVFVYVGAVAVLIVFTILLTRRDAERIRGFNWTGLVAAVAVFGGLLWSVLTTPLLGSNALPAKTITVKQIGEALMSEYVWPLQCAGILLTVALLGALILAMDEKL